VQCRTCGVYYGGAIDISGIEKFTLDRTCGHQCWSHYCTFLYSSQLGAWHDIIDCNFFNCSDGYWGVLTVSSSPYEMRHVNITRIKNYDSFSIYTTNPDEITNIPFVSSFVLHMKCYGDCGPYLQSKYGTLYEYFMFVNNFASSALIYIQYTNSELVTRNSFFYGNSGNPFHANSTTAYIYLVGCHFSGDLPTTSSSIVFSFVNCETNFRRSFIWENRTANVNSCEAINF
jgi:hypothetical protein